MTQPPASYELVKSRLRQRHWRNYLLDRRFQLRFAAYTLVASVLTAALLGVFLWSTSRALLRETQGAVEARSMAAEQSRELGNATLSNVLFEHMNDPAFAAKLQEQSRAIDQKYEDEKSAIVRQRSKLIHQQQVTWVALVGGLLMFVVLGVVFSIVATHRIAGPLYRMRRMVDEISKGQLLEPSQGLRDGDEFKEFFEALGVMVKSLRHENAETLDALERLGAALPPVGGAKAELDSLRAKLRARLGKDGVQSFPGGA